MRRQRLREWKERRAGHVGQSSQGHRVWQGQPCTGAGYGVGANQDQCHWLLPWPVPCWQPRRDCGTRQDVRSNALEPLWFTWDRVWSGLHLWARPGTVPQSQAGCWRETHKETIPCAQTACKQQRKVLKWKPQLLSLTVMRAPPAVHTDQDRTCRNQAWCTVCDYLWIS